MICPKCEIDSPVLETRRAFKKVIRRRRCPKCGADFVTSEDYLDKDEGKEMLRIGRFGAYGRSEDGEV